MSLSLKLAPCLLLLGYGAMGQTAPAPAAPKLFVYYLLPGDKAYQWKSVDILPPLSLNLNAAGNAQLSTPVTAGPQGPAGPPGPVGPPGPGVTVSGGTAINGTGLLFGTAPPEGTTAIGIDKNVTAYRIPASATPLTGSCDGSAAWSADKTRFSVCVPSSPGSPSSEWVSVPVISTNYPVTPYIPPVYGVGFVVLNSPGMPPQIELNTAYVAFRVAAPAGPGPCVDPISGWGRGTGAWAADSTGFYTCVQNADKTGFVWVKSPASATW